MSLSVNCQAPSNILNENNKNSAISHTQTPSLNLIYSTPIIPNGSLNPIRKRKVKFAIQLTIQELLSVPYLNGVLFCKVRLCDGGHYVSYSSKKEVSNSSVLWTNDSPIQFEVKTTQFYQYTNLVSSPVKDGGNILNLSTSNTNTNNQNNSLITGYEPCLCRISVRKELRGGKSYQKLGYVDCNLTDFIFKYQLEQNQLIQSKNNNVNNIQSNSDEFSVNRILKEYETGSHISSKKNQQRLDNSYLKIKIKIIDNCQNSAQKDKNITWINNSNKDNSNNSNNVMSNNESEKSNSLPTSPKPAAKSISPSITFSCDDKGIENKTKITVQSQQLSTSYVQSPELGPKKNKLSSPIVSVVANGQNFTPSHSRNSSSSTTNSTINTNNLSIQPPTIPPFVNGHYRSYSNGSIKSNVSFDFLLKNRNKKLLEDVQSTSSSSSQIVNGQANSQLSNNNNSNLIHQQFDQHQIIHNKLTHNSSSSPALVINSIMTNSNKIEQTPNSNLHIIETRVDANDIINQIENELTNRLSSNIKTTIPKNYFED